MNSRRLRSPVRRSVKPDTGLAEIVLPAIIGLVFRCWVKMLLAKARPPDQMPFVNLERAIEAGIEDCRHRDHTLVKGLPFADKSQAHPDDDLGRSKIDATRGYLDLSPMGERTAYDGDHGWVRPTQGSSLWTSSSSSICRGATTVVYNSPMSVKPSFSSFFQSLRSVAAMATIAFPW